MAARTRMFLLKLHESAVGHSKFPRRSYWVHHRLLSALQTCSHNISLFLHLVRSTIGYVGSTSNNLECLASRICSARRTRLRKCCNVNSSPGSPKTRVRVSYRSAWSSPSRYYSLGKVD